MINFKQPIIDFLKKETGIENIELTTTPNPDMGDFAFPCFLLAKYFKKAPDDIAIELSSKYNVTAETKELIPEAKASGAYVNGGGSRQEIIAEGFKPGRKYNIDSL